MRNDLSAAVHCSIWIALGCGFEPAVGQTTEPARSPMEVVRVVEGGFALEPSGRRFEPFGFNYDHDERGRLIEDYWHSEWAKVEEDFAEMKDLGANLVRIHLQIARFMQAKERADEAALARLFDLLSLCERLGLYLDITGLGCYHAQDVPEWYDALEEGDRWNVQAAFWVAIAQRCSGSPAVFCYDLMNEPVVPGGPRQKNWLGPPFAGKHFVQFITRELGDRSRPDVAKEWTEKLTTAIRKHDPRRLITVGLVPWSLERPGLTSGFVPDRIAAHLDFLSVHIYPDSLALDDALSTIEGFRVGKPVLVEETFPLRCSVEELLELMGRARPNVAGWISFYWGRTIEESKTSGTLQDAIVASWLEAFTSRPPKKATEAEGRDRRR